MMHRFRQLRDAGLRRPGPAAGGFRRRRMKITVPCVGAKPARTHCIRQGGHQKRSMIDLIGQHKMAASVDGGGINVQSQSFIGFLDRSKWGMPSQSEMIPSTPDGGEEECPGKVRIPALVLSGNARLIPSVEIIRISHGATSAQATVFHNTENASRPLLLSKTDLFPACWNVTLPRAILKSERAQGST